MTTLPPGTGTPPGIQPAKTAAPQDGPAIRVLIVDDSAVIRTVISRTLAPEQGIEVVGTAGNGELGVTAVARLKPDVVILDIEMPVMDGLTALPLMLKEKPDVRVLICSTLSARGADISIRALTLGATDCLLKPVGNQFPAPPIFNGIWFVRFGLFGGPGAHASLRLRIWRRVRPLKRSMVNLQRENIWVFCPQKF